MHGPQPGKYILKVAFGPRPSIGANFGGPPTVPVVADGPDKLFTVSKLNDGNYILPLEHRFTREDHGNVVATLDSACLPFAVVFDIQTKTSQDRGTRR
ncbi:hypothetical protein OG21DRAFT_173267 [Imleria badia]|nr:hypothetical protein OG21DRAFT_173267 [Imleria badia]